MKLKRLLLIALTTILLLTGCQHGGNLKKVEKGDDQTAASDKKPKEDKKPKDDKGQRFVADITHTSPETAARGNEWIRSVKMWYGIIGPIEYRITKIYTDEEGIRKMIDNYNKGFEKESDKLTKYRSDGEARGIPLRAFDYEVRYLEGYSTEPGDGKVESPTVNFIVCNARGGALEAPGIYMRPMVSQLVPNRPINIGEVFRGRAVFSAPLYDAGEDYYIINELKDHNRDTQRTWNFLERVFKKDK